MVLEPRALDPFFFFVMKKTTMTGATRNSIASKNSFESIQYAASTSNDDSFSHNFNLQLTIHKLNERNYLKWVQSMKLVIDGRGKLRHLIGEVTQPAKNDPFLKKMAI